MRVSVIFAALIWFAQIGLADEPTSYDVVVYGGTSGGVAAAVQVKRMGKSVVLIEPTKHLGGLTSGGLGATDIGNKGVIGGVSREFYRRVKKHYEDPAAWKFQRPEQYRSGRSSEAATEDAMWTFEPHVAEKIMRDLLREAGVPVVFGERLDLKRGVTKDGTRIVALRMESGREFRGRRFIDATYEGDLMALAGVSYHVGREANATYGETLNGVQVKNSVHHQFVKLVDPFLRPGDKSSGLLFGIDPAGPGEEGAGDRRVQTYNLRICASSVPENRLPWPKPADYDPAKYELLLRNFDAGDDRRPWNPILMPNGKTDSNNNFAVSTDFIGANYDYPDGDYATRDRVFREHLVYTQGLMWTLANHERVPKPVRDHFQQWGLPKDEFSDHDHWPHQLYVREARRMISDCVMTQHHCQGRATADDAVGMAAYTMDSHNVQRYVDASGHVRNEGDVQVGGFSPYPIAYRSIAPQESQCANLLVPVCLAASHIAYGSIRMEPVFMVLGQSAATAACQSIDSDTAVQKVDIKKLHERLLADGQVLAWTGPQKSAVTGIDPAKLLGLVFDDGESNRIGVWLESSSIGGFVGARYWHDNNEGKGQKSFGFEFQVKTAGLYEVRLAYTSNSNRATNVPVTVEHANGETMVKINQRLDPPLEKAFVSVGVFRFEPDKRSRVWISNAGTDGFVIGDALQLLPTK